MADYDLPQIICLLFPDSIATSLAFQTHETNHAYRAPKKGGGSIIWATKT